MIPRNSIGIEIAGKHLRIAVLHGAFGNLKVLRTLEVADFLDLSPVEQKSAVIRLIQTHKLASGHVYLSLPRDRGIVRQMDFPVEVREKLRSVILLQLDTLCPWPTEDIYWDCTYDAKAAAAKTITATVVMIPKSALDPWIAFFSEVKLPLSGVSLSAVSLAHGVQALWGGAVPSAVLLCERGTIEGSLVHAGRLVSMSQPGEDATSTAKLVMERLTSIGRVSVSPENLRVVACGSASGELQGIASANLPIPNAKPDTLIRFGAVSAALAGMRKTSFDANLLPKEKRHHHSQLQLIPTYVMLGLAVLLGLAMAAREPYQYSLYATQIDAEIDRIAPAVEDIAAQESELNTLSEKYRALTAHLTHVDRNLEAMREVSRVLPNDTWLSNYTYQENGINISGFAGSATEIQRVLEDSPLFKDVQFASPVTRDASGKDRFTLRATFEVTP